jgi:hypothetical protein
MARDQSDAWYRSIRKVAREWAETFGLDAPMYEMRYVKLTFLRDVRKNHPELLDHYTARAFTVYEGKVMADLWNPTGGAIRSIFKTGGYIQLPATRAILRKHPSATDLLMRIPSDDDDDVAYLDLFVDNLIVGTYRRRILADNADNAYREFVDLLLGRLALLPPERRNDKERRLAGWLPNIFSA